MNELLQTRLCHLPMVCPPSLQWREEVMPFVCFWHLIQISLMVFLETTRNSWSIFTIITSDMSENCYNSISLPLFRLNEPNCFSLASEHLWGHYPPDCSNFSSLECGVYSGHWPLAFQVCQRQFIPWILEGELVAAPGIAFWCEWAVCSSPHDSFLAAINPRWGWDANVHCTELRKRGFKSWLYHLLREQVIGFSGSSSSSVLWK